MGLQTKDDLAKYTIPQLKEKLKQRRLATSGTKAELVGRLFDSLQEEDKLLEAGGTELDVLLDNNSNTGGNISTNEELLLLGIEKDDNKKAPKEVTETTKDEPSAITEPEPNADQSPKKERPAIAAPEVPEGEKKAVSSEGDARAKRALRFGLPVEPVKSPPEAKANGQEKKPEIKTTDPKLLARAKRFGLPVGGPGDAVSPAKVAKTVVEDEKLKARRLRFGI